MERLHGNKITEVEVLQAQGINPKELVDIGARAFFKMVLIDGLFHGDLHGGNLFAMKNYTTGESQIGVIDFGIVGRLSEKSRDAFSRMVLALLVEDYESLCYEYADLAAYGTGINFEQFQAEVRNTLSPYMGLNLKEVQIGKVLIDATRIAVRYNIKIPSEWMIVFKAIFTLEGLGRQLDPDFDLLALGQDLVRTSLKDRYSMQRIGKDTAWVVRDLTALLQTMPRQIRWMFRKFNSNDFAFEVKFKDTEILRRQLERGYRGVGLSILSASLFISSAVSLSALPESPRVFGYWPVHSFVLLTLGMLGLLGLLIKKWR
jgi:ubiquinone biosynthesis protein